MTWDLMWLVIHVVLLLMCAVVYSQAPDRVQKLVVFSVALSAIILVGYYAARIVGFKFDNDAAIKAGALTFEHIGVILYMIRVTLKEKGLCQTSSPHGR